MVLELFYCWPTVANYLQEEEFWPFPARGLFCFVLQSCRYWFSEGV